jgi:hypothetical protein
MNKKIQDIIDTILDVLLHLLVIITFIINANAFFKEGKIYVAFILLIWVGFCIGFKVAQLLMARRIKNEKQNSKADTN